MIAEEPWATWQDMQPTVPVVERWRYMKMGSPELAVSLPEPAA
jgi:hypothetical protein